MLPGPLSVEEALRRILDAATPLPAVDLDAADALGGILAEPVHADLDSPPFDKALVDGFAVRSTDLTGAGAVTLQITSEVLAGQWPATPVQPGSCASIMTGAPIPPGADAVVMHERTERIDATTVRLSGPVPAGQNRFPRGREMAAGELVLPEGRALNAAAIGLLAAVGRTRVRVVRRPVVALVPTGDELVEPGQVPGLGQIRNSNAATLAALVRSLGYPAQAGPIVRDDAQALRDRFRSLLDGSDAEGRPSVILISGGVSAGKLDLVPAALEAVGVEPRFHRVAIKPGKPLWFGVGARSGGGGRTLVFGLPGNPVSGVVNVLRFVQPALAILAGGPRHIHELPTGILAVPVTHRGDRPTYHPAWIERAEDGRSLLRPLPWAGSPDLRSLAQADGFIAIPAGDAEYPAGHPLPFLPWPGRAPSRR